MKPGSSASAHAAASCGPRLPVDAGAAGRPAPSHEPSARTAPTRTAASAAASTPSASHARAAAGGASTRRKAGRAWLSLGALLAAGSLVVGALHHHAADASAAAAIADRLDWQPALAAAEPWRAFSAAFVHFSSLHLAANLAGVALTTALGVASRLPSRAAAAWLLAWPLTQLGLLVQPALEHYGGLSGVLHAGVAVAATQLVIGGGSAGRRRLGAAIAVGLVVKVLAEAPWAGALTHPSGWDIAVAPGAHLSGVCAGLLACLAVHACHRRIQRPDAV